MKRKFTILTAALALLACLTIPLGMWGQTRDSYSYTFTSSQFNGNGTETLNSVEWTLSGDGGYWGYDGTKGQQFGSGSKPYKTMTLATSDIPGTITEIKLNTSGASSISATMNVTVGGNAFGDQISLTASATEYTFTGSASGTIAFNYSQSSSKAIYIKSITVTYTSGPTTYTVTYNGNGADGGTTPVDNNTYQNGATVTVLANTFTKTGNTFAYWTTDQEGNDGPYEAGDEYPITANTIFYAQWSVNTYNYTLSVTGDDNEATAELYVDGSAVAQGAKIAYEKEVTVVVATNTGYNYSIEVKDASNNDITVANDKFTMPASDVTVTVTTTLIPTYTITFETGTGVSVEPMSGLEGSPISLPTTTPSSDCVSRGWSFAGWATESVTETTTAPTLLSGNYILNGNATLYAVYKVTEGEGGTTEFNFSEIAEANSWENGEAYTVVTIAPVTIVAQGGGNNGKWYTSGDGSWRMYSGGTVEISADNYAVTAVTSTPTCEFTISNGIATFSPSARTDFTNITVTYGSSTITYNSNPSCLPMVATPTFTPAAGTYTGAQNVTIECDTDGATIQYKTTEEGEWQNYSAAIPVSTTTTIWAKATNNGMDDSEVAEATYTIQYTLTVDIDDVVEYFLFDYHDGIWDDITLDENGQALVSSGADIRISGGEVYDDCYEVESFNVTDGNSPIAVNYISESMEYSFIMPASNATLTATLNEIATHYTLIVEGLDYVSFELLVGSMSKITTLDANQASICEESEVTISELTVGTGRVLESVTLTYGNQTTEITPTSGVYVFEMPSSNATLTFTTDTAPTYTLANSIVSGKTYIISDGVDRAMGAQSGNVRSAATITIDNNVATVTNTDVYEFVISGSAEDGYTIYDVKDEGYLYASSSTSNNIGTRAENSDGNSVWTIDFDESAVTITANGTNTRNYIRYNYNNGNDRFSCYASTSSIQDPLYLYVKDEAPVTETYNLDIVGYENGGGWNLIASPVSMTPSTNDIITDTYTGNDNTQRTYDLYYFDQTAESEWKNFRQNSFDLVPGKGYLYANKTGGNYTLTGTPYNGDGIIPLDYSEANPGESMRGLNLIGNPYNANTTIESDREFYIMNSAGSQIIVADDDHKTIAPMQGIFVKAEEPGESVTFTPASQGSSLNNNSSLVLNLIQNRGDVIDRAIVRFGNGGTLPKIQLFENSTKLYISQYNEDYAVVKAETQGEMPVNFRAAENGTYTLSIDAENVEMNYLHLIDNMTGMDIDLLQTPSYTFEATTRDYESRFRLVFAANEDGVSTGSTAFAFFSNGNWIINNDGEATLQVIDVTGRILSSESVNGSVSTTLNATPGVYMLRLINGENVKVQKIVVR